MSIKYIPVGSVPAIDVSAGIPGNDIDAENGGKGMLGIPGTPGGRGTETNSHTIKQLDTQFRREHIPLQNL